MKEAPLPVSALTHKARQEHKSVPDIRVTYRVFSPPQITDQQTAIILLSGAFIEGQSTSQLAQSFANNSGLPVYGMNAEVRTRTKPTDDTERKAGAMAKAFPGLPGGSDIKKVIVVGHSKGAFEGMVMEERLNQNGNTGNGNLEVVGGIYFAPPGFTHRLPSDLVLNAGTDFLRSTVDLITHPRKRRGQLSIYMDYLIESGIGLKRNHVRGVIAECGEINHIARRRTRPAVFIFGSEDPMANLDEIVHQRYRRLQDGERRYLLDHFFLENPPLTVMEVFGGYHGWSMVNPEEAARTGWDAFRKLVETH